MKKEISPELYNYNKFPGPSFARVGDKVVAENIELDLVENYKDAFDQTVFGQRFSQLMLKFDYIVGDWGNEQLRLKGFYKDDKVVRSDLKIGRLDDYLTEFCNFGCAYFVLENANPQELPEEVEDKQPRRRRSRNRNRNRSQDAKRMPEQKPATNRDKETKQPQKKDRFVIKQDKSSAKKQENKTTKGDRKPKRDRQPNKKETGETKRGFVIRQK